MRHSRRAGSNSVAAIGVRGKRQCVRKQNDRQRNADRRAEQRGVKKQQPLPARLAPFFTTSPPAVILGDLFRAKTNLTNKGKCI